MSLFLCGSSVTIANEIDNPTEGQEFIKTGESVAIAFEIRGTPNAQLSLTWILPPDFTVVPINLTLNENGVWTNELAVDKVGGHILQLRQGHENFSGATLDTRSFVVREDDDPGEGGEPE